MENRKKVPLKNKLAYGIGTGGGNVFSQIAAAFLLNYYTDTALIGAGAIATMFLVCRVFDGITDLLMGAAALLLIGLILIYLLVRNQVYKKKMSMLASIAAVCLIPVGAYFINFTSPDVQYYTLMEMAVCLIYLLMIIMLLQLDWKTWISKILKGCGIFVLCGLVYYNVINCNIAYFNMNLSYHKSISIAEDVLQRIEQMDEFQNQHDKVVIMGDYNCATENLYIMMPSIMGISNDSFLNDSYHYTIIWNYCFGVQMEQASYDEMMEIVETDEYKNMSVYPLKGCVEYINGIIVVKMQE